MLNLHHFIYNMKLLFLHTLKFSGQFSITKSPRTPIRANLIASDFRHRLMRTHLAIFFADRGDVAVLKTHVIKSPNLMGWLCWRFTAINIENRENGHTWRMPANLIADIWHGFHTPIAAIGENRNRCTGHTWRFSPIAAIVVWNRQVCRWLYTVYYVEGGCVLLLLRIRSAHLAMVWVCAANDCAGKTILSRAIEIQKENRGQPHIFYR